MATSTRPWVLITGIGGLIGTRVAAVLHPDYQVIGIDLREEEELCQPHAPYTYYRVDLTDELATTNVFADIRSLTGGPLTSTIHLAAHFDYSDEPSPLYDAVAVDATRRILASLRSFPQAEQFIFSSSLYVMQPNNTPGPITESAPVEGTWDYPESKIKAEQVIFEEHGEIPAVSLRIAEVYDEAGHSFALGQQIHRIHDKHFEGYMYPSNDDRGQAMVHLDDLGNAVRNTIDRRLELSSYEIFLMAEDDILTYGDRQEQLGQLIHGEEWDSIRVPKLMAKAGAFVRSHLVSDEEPAFVKPWMIDLADNHYAPDITKARTHLGWSPKHRLRNTLPQIVESLNQNPEQFKRENFLETEDLSDEKK